MNYEEIKQNILNNINIDIDKREGSFLNNMISPVAVELTKAYIELENILNLGFIETNFNYFLDKRVNEFGIYRKNGTKATGSITVEGKEGAYLEANTIIKANGLYFKLMSNISLPVNNTAIVEAEEIGTIYNLKENTEFELIEKNYNITKISNSLNFEGGTDNETDEELRQRFKETVTNIETSGNKNHFKKWALEVEGVGMAKVFPLWNGNGTVKVLIADTNNKPLDNAVIERAYNYINEVMPIGCSLTVTTVKNKNVDITAKVELNKGYLIDNLIEKYKILLEKYIKETSNIFYYSKAFGLLAKMEEIEDIKEFTINNQFQNIDLDEESVIFINSIEITEE